MKIQVLGSDCPTCKKLYKTVEEVVEKLNLGLEVEYSTDIAKIIEIGAMSSPVFAIDGKLINSGKLLTAEEIEKAILTEKNQPEKNQDFKPSAPRKSCCCRGNC